MWQDFSKENNSEEFDDIDRLFELAGRQDPPVGKAFEDTLNSLSRWQPQRRPATRFPHNSLLVKLSVAVMLVLVIGGLFALIVSSDTFNYGPVQSYLDEATATINGPNVSDISPVASTPIAQAPVLASTISGSFATQTNSENSAYLSRLVKLNGDDDDYVSLRPVSNEADQNKRISNDSVIHPPRQLRIN